MTKDTTVAPDQADKFKKDPQVRTQLAEVLARHGPGPRMATTYAAKRPTCRRRRPE